MTSKQSPQPVPIADTLDALVLRIGRTLAWANLLLVGVILAQVVMRYGFHHGLVPLEELMWHLYALAAMVGMSYAVSSDVHIRIDLLRGRMSPRAQRVWEIFGILFLLYPFIFVLFHHSLEWVATSYRMGEASTSPTGLPYRWLIKSVIPVSFFLLFLAASARLLREAAMLLRGRRG